MKRKNGRAEERHKQTDELANASCVLGKHKEGRNYEKTEQNKQRQIDKKVVKEQVQRWIEQNDRTYTGRYKLKEQIEELHGKI